MATACVKMSDSNALRAGDDSIMYSVVCVLMCRVSAEPSGRRGEHLPTSTFSPVMHSCGAVTLLRTGNQLLLAHRCQVRWAVSPFTYVLSIYRFLAARIKSLVLTTEHIACTLKRWHERASWHEQTAPEHIPVVCISTLLHEPRAINRHFSHAGLELSYCTPSRPAARRLWHAQKGRAPAATHLPQSTCRRAPDAGTRRRVMAPRRLS